MYSFSKTESEVLQIAISRDIVVDWLTKLDSGSSFKLKIWHRMRI